MAPTSDACFEAAASCESFGRQHAATRARRPCQSDLGLLKDAHVAPRATVRVRLRARSHRPEPVMGEGRQDLEQNLLEYVIQRLVGVQDPRNELRKDSQPLHV